MSFTYRAFTAKTAFSLNIAVGRSLQTQVPGTARPRHRIPVVNTSDSSRRVQRVERILSVLYAFDLSEPPCVMSESFYLFAV